MFIGVCSVSCVLLGEKGVDASVDGVLGGYGHVNEQDIKSSEAFLNTLLVDRFPNGEGSRQLVALGNELATVYLCVSPYRCLCSFDL